MTAHPAPERLGAYLDGELDAPARATVDAHLRECAECAAHLSDLTAVDDAARRTPLDAPDGYFDDFASRVRARLEKRATARWRPPVWSWAAAAALLLAVVTPLVLQSPRATQTVSYDSSQPAPAVVPEVGGQREAALSPAATLAGAPAAARPADAITAPPEEQALAERALEARRMRADRQQPRLAARDEAPGAAAVARAPAAPPAAAAPEGQPKRQVGEKEAPADSAKLDDAQRENLRSLGYVAPPPPPAASQAQRGPRSQGAVGLSGGSDAGQAAPKEEKDKQGDVAGFEKSTRDAGVAVMQESVEVSPRPRAIGQGLASVKFRTLAEAPPPRSDGEARTLREAWRAFIADNPAHPQADEARVRLVEAGVLAYTLGRRLQDREIAERDAKAYLERPDATQAARARAAVRKLSP